MKKLIIFISMFVLLSLSVLAGNLTWSDNSSTVTPTSKFGDELDFQATVTGANPPNVSWMIFSWNGTNGAGLVNDSAVSKHTLISATLVVGKTLNLSGVKNFCWRFWANDTNGNWNSTDIWCANSYAYAGNYSWSNNLSTLTTYSRRYENVTFNITFTSTNPKLYNISHVRFSWNGTAGGALQNDTEANADLVGTYDYGIVKQINLTGNKKICWRFWVNDSGNVWNSTDLWCHTTYNHPTITMNLPSTLQNYSVNTISPNISVTGDASTYSCWFYYNETGNMTQKGGSVTFTDSVVAVFPNVTISDGSWKWNAKCQETGNGLAFSWGTNSTFTVDDTSPVITVNSIIDGHSDIVPVTRQYIRAKNFTLNLTVTEANIRNCSYYLTLSNNGTLALNQTNTTGISSGTSASFFTRTDVNTTGIYTFYVNCSDYSSNIGGSTRYSFTVDIVPPSWTSIANYTINNCTHWGINFTASETLDYSTVYSGNSSNPRNVSNYTTDGTNRIHKIPLNNEWEKWYNINLTMVDLAGNYNQSTALILQYSPVPLCTGWNIYTLYDSSYYISKLKTNANASYVYWWNATAQGWVYSDATNLSTGNAVYIYNPADSYWFRGSSSNLAYKRNLSIGHNYLGIGYSSTFGDLSTRQFWNATGTNITADGLNFYVHYFSSWNNTGKNWVSAMYQKSWRNTTTLGRLTYGGLDTLWIWSDFNISVDVNSTGYVYGNWS